MNIAKYFLILTFALCSTGWSQLRWEKRSLEFTPSPSDDKVVAEFHFTNIGTQPIKIKELKTSCGCTTATLDKDVYAPGEKGKITAVFDIGGRTGVQEKTIYVATSDKKEPELVLSFKAIIPKLLEMDNIFLNWQRGEELKPKVVNIKVSGDYPIHHLDVTPSKPEISVEVKHAEGTRDFQIIVTPKKTDAELEAGLEIKPDYPKNPPKYFHIYLRVDH